MSLFSVQSNLQDQAGKWTQPCAICLANSRLLSWCRCRCNQPGAATDARPGRAGHRFKVQWRVDQGHLHSARLHLGCHISADSIHEIRAGRHRDRAVRIGRYRKAVPLFKGQSVVRHPNDVKRFETGRNHSPVRAVPSHIPGSGFAARALQERPGAKLTYRQKLERRKPPCHLPRLPNRFPLRLTPTAFRAARRRARKIRRSPASAAGSAG